MKREKTIEKELLEKLKQSTISGVKLYPETEELSNEAILLIQKASKANLGYRWKFVPINIGKEKCLGVEVEWASERGVSYDGDRVSGYSFNPFKEVVPVYEKDRLKLERSNKNKRNKKLDSLNRIAKEYFTNGIFPKEVAGWKEYLKDNVSYSLMDCLEAIIDGIEEANIAGYDKTETAKFVEQQIDEFLKTEKEEKEETKRYKKAFEAMEIQERYNYIAKKYYKPGQYPSGYNIEPYLKNPNTPGALKDILKEIEKLSSSIINMQRDDYWIKLGPLVNEFLKVEEELKKQKDNVIKDSKEEYKKASFLEKIKELLKKKGNGSKNM